MLSESYFILYVADQRRSRAFYSTVFELEPRLDVPGMTEFALPSGGVLGLMPETGIVDLLSLKLDNPARANGITRAELYLLHPSASAYHARSLLAGAKELSPMLPRAWGHHAAYSQDKDGYILAFAFT